MRQELSKTEPALRLGRQDITDPAERTQYFGVVDVGIFQRGERGEAFGIISLFGEPPRGFGGLEKPDAKHHEEDLGISFLSPCRV